jgi:hypothetical protein
MHTPDELKKPVAYKVIGIKSATMAEKTR